MPGARPTSTSGPTRAARPRVLPRALSALVVAALASGGAAGQPAPGEDVGIALTASTVPATGAHAVGVNVTRFGRYALTAASRQGAALQLVDRMSGPGETRGAAGGADGRLDAFLERGEYRLRVLSDPAGAGEVRLEARPFVEVSLPRPPLLPDVADVTTTLADLQQRSWWVQIDADEDFAVELAGRSLADVRLWRDGQWLDPATPACEDIAPEPKRPLRRCALTTRLGAGLWQLVAYGGPAVPWSVSEPEQPLHVRRGIPSLADAARLSGVIGPFGTERWLAPGVATTFRLELPPGAEGVDPAGAALTVRALDPRDPFRRDGTVGRIQKETMPPVAEVTQAPSNEGRVLTVSGAVGQAFTLQHYAKGRGADLRGAGPTWITTLHGGDPVDRPDVTGILLEMTDEGPKIAAGSLMPLAKQKPYRRKFNVLGTTALGFQVTDEADYQVATAGSRVAWRWEPYLPKKPKGYVAPEAKEGAHTTRLTTGWWTLTLLPVTPGAAEVVVRADPKQRVEPSAPRANVQFAGVVLEPGARYTLHLDGAEASGSGVITRSLPVDLATPLPVTLAPGESVVLAVVAPARGSVAAPGLGIARGDEAPAARLNVDVGSATVTLTNTGAGIVQTALAFTRPDARTAPLPPLPDTAVPAPPPLPALTTAAPRALDLAREGTSTFALKVATPGLYRVESTGLLATAGAIRTRTRPSLVSAAENGVGRNFLLQTYLREGDYQVTVGARGLSAGHLGLRTAPTTLRDGGVLRDGVPARATVPAGEGVVYRFEAPEAGEYVLRAFGMGRLFRVRLEDEDGWPIVAPETDGDLRLDLEPGAYRLVVLPEAVDTTRITTLERVRDPVERTGHGPFALALDAAAEHVWWEPAEGAERVPDTWTFSLAAPADVTVSADAEMTGEVVPVVDGKDAAPVARLVPGRAWTGRLQAGGYRLHLVNARRNSAVPYTVRVSPRELVPGLSRAVDVPAEIPVSVGAESLYELASMGLVDVSARLFDAGGRVVAASDDRPDDWNFRVLERLAPGPYTLRVEPVGEAAGRTTISMARAGERDEPALAAGAAREVTPGAGVLRVPLTLPATGLLVASARSSENVGIAVEAAEGATWRTLGEAEGTEARVLVRLREGADLRLRVTSLDGRGLPATVRADVIAPRVVSEGAFAGGASAPAGDVGLGAFVVEAKAPGALALDATLGVAWCPEAGEACVPAPDTLVGQQARAVWLVADAAGGRGKRVALRGSRWTLGSAPGRVTVPAGQVATVDVAPAEGPVLVFASAEARAPGIAMATDFEEDPLRVADGAGGRAVAVSLGGGRAVRVFAAEGRGPIEVGLTRTAFSAPAEGGFEGDTGAAGGVVPAGGAWRAALPEEVDRARVVLAEGLVAVLSEGDAPGATVWAADGPRDVTLATGGADTLTILNPMTGQLSTGEPAAWAVSATTAGGVPALTSEAPKRETVANAAGRLRFEVVGAPGARLHVLGAATGAVVRFHASGRVVRGRDVPVEEPGTVEIVHGAGPWVAWMATGGARERVLWGETGSLRENVVIPPGVEPVSEAAHAFWLLAPPGVVRVRAGQPVVARVRERVFVAEDGVFEIPVGSGPTGSGERVGIALRAFGGGALRGNVEVDARPATVLGEGLGPEAVIGAGEARAWRFTVPETTAVGVGVRTASADLQVTLFTDDGTLVGRGPVRMETLDAGSYLLVASLPPESAPALVRPAVVGLSRPDTGPPAEVVRGYLVAAGLLPPDAAGTDASESGEGEGE